MTRPRFDQFGHLPTVILGAVGVALIAAGRRVLTAVDDAHDVDLGGDDR